jgi:hypothetical protein
LNGPQTAPAPAAAPAAAGGYAPALPKDPGLVRLLADPAIGSTAKAIAVALVDRWAWRKDSCWPSDATIAGAVGRSPGHVNRCLRQLERAGWVDRRRDPALRNGRRIVILWRRDGPPGAKTPLAPALRPPLAPARGKAIVSSKRSRQPEVVRELVPTTTTRTPEPPGPRTAPRASPPAPPGETATAAPTRQAAAQGPPRARHAWSLGESDLAATAARTGDPILLAELLKARAPKPAPAPSPLRLPLSELLAGLPGNPGWVEIAARALCVAVDDHGPATFKTCAAMTRAVAAREVAAAVLADCLRQATGPHARHPGKVLVAAWKRDAVRAAKK